MKQLVITYGSPAKAIDVPVPALKQGFILVKNRFSAVSVGTERVSASYGNMNLLEKIKAKPEQVKQVIQSIRTNGLTATLSRVNAALEKSIATGYSSSGIVVAVGENVSEFNVGDRVACGGGGYAVHADYCLVPKRLAVRIPENVNLEYAAFSTIGAVAMHGYRVGEVNVCEKVAVIGLGIIGQLLCQIAAAAGAEVIAIDLKESRVNKAISSGAHHGVVIRNESEIADIMAITSGRGLDVVFLCASTTSSEPATFASKIARDRGRLIVVGDVGMNLDRQTLYDKELSISVSRSYGPGRYDRMYEERGNDYPYSYIRWTEQRNIEAFLDLLSKQKLNLKDIITHKFSINQAEEAFDLFVNPLDDDPIGALFEYEEIIEDLVQTIKLTNTPERNYKTKRNSTIAIGLIGPGSFARNTLLPALFRQNIIPIAVASTTGLAPTDVAKRFGFQYATTNINNVMSNEEINSIFITTRHDSHASLVVQALENKKYVYVEKPLATTITDLILISKSYEKSNTTVMVGYNRRFAPFSTKIKELLSPEIPPVIMIRVNAGAIENSHWSMSEDEGGGRIIGEACHFVDLMQFFAGSHISSVFAKAQRDATMLEQDVVVTFSFENGAIGTLVYTSKGDSQLPKEYIEIYWGGNVAVINDFKELNIYMNGKKISEKSRQDKGFNTEMELYVRHLKGELPTLIKFKDLANSTLATIGILESSRNGTPVLLTCNES